MIKIMTPDIYWISALTRIKVCIIGAILIQLVVAGYSNAQSLYVTVERDIFEMGAPIRASAKVENVEEKEVEWVFVASLLSKDPRAPVPRSFVKRVQLEPGEQTQISISMSTEGLIYEGEYELISGLYDIARKPIAKSTQKIRLRGGMKRLDIEFKMCKDSACETPAMMFVQGETVYINYITKVETPLIEASLVLPDQSKTNLTLPAAIVVEQEGDYQVNAVITKPGYQTVKKFFMFGVIEPIHPWLGISIKDTDAYKDKEVFIIADTDWKNVLSLVPVTVWTDSMTFKLKVRKYPTLIYHQEGSNNLDVDSIIHFLQQYRPSRVTIVEPLPKTLGLLLASHSSTQFGAGLSFKQFRFITPADYLSYWKKYNTVVYAADNYDIALIAATYASLINAPLIIKNSKLDTPANLKGKRIICVGKMQPMIGCVESYNKSSLLKRYLKLIGASEVVLVNSKDLKLGMPGQFQPEKTPVPIGTTFSKLSLGAPILASARHALLLSVNLDANDCGPYEGTSNTQFIATDEYVRETLEDLYGSYHLPITKPKPGFLTIVASPKAIPYWSDCNNSYSGAADWQYGSINNEDPNLHVGRIYSTTISGVSAYIARTLFYKQVLNNAYTANTYTGLAIAAPNFSPDQDNAQQIRDETVDDGYNSICFTWHGAASQPNCDVYTNIQPTDYQDKQFVSFADHGSSTGWGGTLASDDIPWLDVPYTISLACQTNNFWGGGSLTFGPTWIRKGGISYHASIPSTNGYDWELWAIQELTSAQRQSLGEMATNLINRTDYTSEVKRQYILLGDPTLVPYAKEVTW